MDKMRMESVDLTQKNIEKIYELFPSVVTEKRGEDGKVKKAVNFELLRQLLSSEAIEGDEAYEFTWVGKKEAVAEAGRPIRKTLRPSKEESKNWDLTENLYIEGDNLEVLKLLQESYLGKVKMIYIDPPYNTGKDFVYKDNFNQSKGDYEQNLGVIDEEGNRLFQNTETNGRFHSDWCSMIYPRMVLSRNLLKDDGVIFISIDDNEVDNMIKICDEVFGESNFVTNLIWQKKTGASDAKGIATITEYILVYSKSESQIKKIFTKNRESYDLNRYKYEDEFKEKRGPYYIDNLDRGGLQYSDSLNYGIECPDGTITYPNGRTEYKNEGWIWKWSKGKVEWARKTGFIEFRRSNTKESGWSVCYKNYLQVDNEDNAIERSAPHKNIITDVLNANAAKAMKDIFSINLFNYSKPFELIKRLISYVNCEDEIILDFFSGSATTAHAVMKLNAEDYGNRKFIMVQLPEVVDEKSEANKAGFNNICEIGKERIRRAGEKIIDKNKGAGGLGDLDFGFRVFKLDDSNMKDVYYSADQMTQDLLEQLESNIKENRTDLDLLYGSLLEWGLPLSLPYSSEAIGGATIHVVNDGDLIACFDSAISEEVVQEIANRRPLRVVFRDDSFENTPAKINVEEIFKLLAPNTRVKVI